MLYWNCLGGCSVRIQEPSKRKNKSYSSSENENRAKEFFVQSFFPLAFEMNLFIRWRVSGNPINPVAAITILQIKPKDLEGKIDCSDDQRRRCWSLDCFKTVPIVSSQVALKQILFSLLDLLWYKWLRFWSWSLYFGGSGGVSRGLFFAQSKPNMLCLKLCLSIIL